MCVQRWTIDVPMNEHTFPTSSFLFHFRAVQCKSYFIPIILSEILFVFFLRFSLHRSCECVCHSTEEKRENILGFDVFHFVLYYRLWKKIENDDGKCWTIDRATASSIRNFYAVNISCSEEGRIKWSWIDWLIWIGWVFILASNAAHNREGKKTTEAKKRKHRKSHSNSFKITWTLIIMYLFMCPANSDRHSFQIKSTRIE